MQKIRLGVIYGGPSVEHEIAVISASQAMAAANTDKYEVIPIFITKEGKWYTGEALKDVSRYSDLPALLQECNHVFITATRGEHKLTVCKKSRFGKQQELPLDVILPVMHGAHGEDGCLQGLLELLNIPYAGPGVLGAAVGMDKIMMKAVLKAAGIPVVDSYDFTSVAWFADQDQIIKAIEERLNYPLIVKPANLGSSVGISRAENLEELLAAVDTAVGFTNRILVEHCLEHMREINCSVLGALGEARASVCEEPITDSDFLTYKDKYMGGSQAAKGGLKTGAKTAGVKTAGMSGSRRQIPADLSAERTKEMQDLARRSFIALDGRGVARVDMLIDVDNDALYVNEINTIPGSLSFYLWEASGLDFASLIDELVRLALQQSRNKNKLTFSFDTNILAGFAGGGAKGAKGVK